MIRGMERAVMAVAVATLALAAPGQGQQSRQCPTDASWGVAPIIARDANDDRRLGARGSLDICRSGHSLTADYPKSYYLGAGARFAWVEDGNIPHGLEASVHAGLSVSLYKSPPFDLRAHPDSTPLPTNRGYVGIGVGGRLESSPDGDEGAAAVGLELRYGHSSQPWVPSFVITWDRVRPTTSEARTAAGLRRDGHSRFMARTYWRKPFNYIHLEIDAAWFRASGPDPMLEAQGWDGGAYLEGTVGVPLGGSWGVFTLESVFVSYAEGQLPTAPDHRKAWTVGIEVGSRE